MHYNAHMVDVWTVNWYIPGSMLRTQFLGTYRHGGTRCLNFSQMGLGVAISPKGETYNTRDFVQGINSGSLTIQVKKMTWGEGSLKHLLSTHHNPDLI